MELAHTSLKAIPLFQEAYNSPNVPTWFKDLLLKHQDDKLPYKNVMTNISGSAVINAINHTKMHQVILPDNHVRSDIAALFFTTLLGGGAKFYTKIGLDVLESNFNTSNFDNWYKKADLSSYKSGIT